MATVNRYTQLSTPRYSPMSLQELMLAPAYKRQQHDAMSESIATTETALAQIDPLDIHSDIAKAEQQRLYDQLNKQSELLAREGFNNTTKSDILRLNKDYQTTVGPTGLLGKAQLAKETLSKEKENYIANATKLGHDPVAASQNWDDHVAEYSKNFNGKIENIKPLYAPNYKDPVAELKSLLKDAGMSSSDISTVGSNIVFDDTKGSYVLTSKARTSNSNNIKQLEDAVDYMNNQVLNPNSDIGKSIKHNRKDPNSVLQELSGLNKVYQKTDVATETGSQISNFSPLKNEDNDITANGGGLTVASTQYSPAKFSGTTYGEITNSINDLILKGQEKGGLTQSEQSTLLEMQNFQKSIDEVLQKDSTYIDLKNTHKQALLEEEAIRNGTYDYTKNPLYNPSVKNESINMINKQIVSKVNSLNNEISEYTKPFVNEAKLKVTEYAITPLTSKQKTSYDIINENADRLLRVSPQSLEQLGDITEIIDPNGEQKAITTPTDQQGIANMIFNAKPGSVQVVSHVARGVSGKPEVVFRIETNEENKYDLDGVFGSRGYDGDIGGGKPLQVRLAFDTTSNEVGINNMLGLLQDYVASTGPVGQEFVQSQKINQAKSKYAGRTWGELENQTENNAEINLLYAQELKARGLNSNSPVEEIERVQKELRNTKIER